MCSSQSGPGFMTNGTLRSLVQRPWLITIRRTSISTKSPFTPVTKTLLELIQKFSLYSREMMATPARLGLLNYCRIWHDNSGKGKYRSWFLSFISVRDIQTGEKFEFICNKWLAVERGDGNVDRLLPVAGIGEATEFSHLFNQK